MKISLNKSTLTVLGLILAAGNVAAAENTQQTTSAINAAQAVRELIDAGIIKVDAQTGAVTLQKSVLEVLKDAGLAQDSINGSMVMGGCSATTGGCFAGKPQE